MKIFGWMQSKLNGKQTTKPTGGASTTNHKVYEPRKDEFSDWPHGLLAIGTFGNKASNEINEDSKKDIDSHEENPSLSTSEDQLDFTPEEVGKLQKELTKLLSRKPVEQTESQRRKGINLPLDKFLNCPSSLEVDRTICNKIIDDDSEEIKGDEAADISRSLSMVLGRGKDLSADGVGNNMIKKKSVSFLLKKMFVCSSGFAPTPNIRDQIPESRMEKLLRAILHKKIRPRPTSSAPAPAKKYINYKHSSNKDIVDEHTDEKEDLKYKWVKTDSDYIVLEI